MTDPSPTVTVIIPARPGPDQPASLDPVRAFEYPPDKLEILIARGTQPSAQRNAALREARGELVYFLDDDSIAPPENLRRAVAHFSKPDVALVGGPNLCPPDAPPLEQAFAQVMGSWLAFGPSRARYARFGTVRSTSEKELILCNLVARKQPLLDAGGFDESLYPNEENALMDELQRRNHTLLYDPNLFVYRNPRRTIRAFFKMLRTYGRGRAEQFRLHPTLGSLLNFVPPLFCLYLVAVPWLPIWGLIPIPIYFLALILQAASLGLGPHRFPDRVIPLIALSHIGYGLGFWHGLFTPLRKRAAPEPGNVSVERPALTP